ncbi:MAG TPA: glycosyltransferase family A protein [Acidobacteriaceae bacterium]|nr:glycosyltransferase family A protein [Acidobacteriaceae bacterium]
MTTQPLITVGMPVYNAMPFLPEAMESLLAQQCPNFEILAIIDGATDGSLEYLRSLAANPFIAARLRILSQSNQGVAPTLNRILRECRTPWLIRQDADDVSHPHRIARLLSAIQSAPHAGMFYSLANYHPRGRAVGTFRCTRGTPLELRRVVRKGYLLSICHPTVALHVEKTLALGGYRIGLHNEDADLWWRMALEHEIHCIPDELVGFRQNESSVSARNLTAQAIAALYVQYLLLSKLTGRAPRNFAAIQSQLQTLLSPAKLRAKERLRLCNIHLAQKKYLRAATAVAASAASSPSHLAGRLRDELLPRASIVNGIQPGLFFKHKEALWL